MRNLIVSTGLLLLFALEGLSNPTCPQLAEKSASYVSKLQVVNRIARGLGLRYDIHVEGLADIVRKGTKKVIFMPNHPAFVDPPIMYAQLYKDFQARPLIAEEIASSAIFKPVISFSDAIIVPSLATIKAHPKAVDRMMADINEGLSRGDNFFLYPGGQLSRTQIEKLGANSVVHRILAENQGVRVVLARTRGLWGSAWGYGQTGKRPRILAAFSRSLMSVFFNKIFFQPVPKRRVAITLTEPADFPFTADKMTLNRYMQDFYNDGTNQATWVPYGWWDRKGVRPISLADFQKTTKLATGGGTISVGAKKTIDRYLQEVIGDKEKFDESSRLEDNLGMDSLSRTELGLFLEEQFGENIIPEGEVVETVADVYRLVSIQEGKVKQGQEIKKGGFEPSRNWQKDWGNGRLTMPKGVTIQEAWMNQALKNPRRPIIADAISGEKTYEEVVTALMIMKPMIEKMRGDRVGIMLPASVGGTLFYLATLMAGKTPVLINFSSGTKNMEHAVQTLNLQSVVTARKVIDKLTRVPVAEGGLDITNIEKTFLYAEDLMGVIKEPMKNPQVLLAFAKGVLFPRYLGVPRRIAWRSLLNLNINPSDHAAIIFTSGSEAMPKAVPLNHKNLLSDIASVTRQVEFRASDSILGFLPIFHSFGLTATTVMNTLLGIRTVYHANPLDPSGLVKVAGAFKPTIVAGTPTFLKNIARSSRKEELDSMRLAITGAAAMPDSVYDLLESKMPGVIVLEGYGISETSPFLAINLVSNPIRGSVGVLIDIVDYQIVDPENIDSQLPVGEKGLLLVRGDNIFAGYLGSSKSPFVTTSDGKTWYNTGDLVEETIGRSRHITWKGRWGRSIKRAGEMVPLDGLEKIVEKHFGASADSEGVEFAIVDLAGGRPDVPPLALCTTRNDITVAQVNDAIKAEGYSPLFYIDVVFTESAIPLLGSGKTAYPELKTKYQSHFPPR